jgi:hypothetical protein
MRHRFWTLSALFGILLLTVTARTASADTFNIAWSGVYGIGSGTITAEDLGSGQFSVTEIDGSQDGVSISLLPQGTYGVNGNYVYPSMFPQLDFLGIGFLAGSTEFNIFFDETPGTLVYRECSSNDDAACMNNGAGFALDSFSVTPPGAPVPEPGTLTLLGAGLLGLAGAIRRKFLA